MLYKIGHWTHILLQRNGWQLFRRHLGLAQFKRKASYLFSAPFYIHLDPCSACNLRCRFCPTGTGDATVKKEILEPDTFEHILEHLPLPHLNNIQLYNNGEPFLNPHVHGYVRRFHDLGKLTCIHSNFSAQEYDDDFMRKIVDSGLDCLVISLDGATPDTYNRYRIGGDFNRVLANMRRLVKTKKRLDSESPQLVYKVLLNRYTEPELELARELAQDIGCLFDTSNHFAIPPEHVDEWRAPSLRRDFGNAVPTRFGAPDGVTMNTCCRQLWETLVIGSNGDVYPCCAVSNKDHAIGNLAKQTFRQVWNNEQFRYLRRYVADRDCPAPPFPNLCEHCSERHCTYGCKTPA